MHRPLVIVNFNSNPYSSEAQRSTQELLGLTDCSSWEPGTGGRQNIGVAVEEDSGGGAGEGRGRKFGRLSRPQSHDQFSG